MVARILAGKRPDGTFGLDITKAGYDVLTSDPLLSPTDFVFSSKWNRLERILQAGSGRVSGSGAIGNGYFIELDVTAIGFFPLMTFCILRPGSEHLEDEGWYKFDWAANPGYSSRLRVWGMRSSGGGYNYTFSPYTDYFTPRVSFSGAWGISYILWDLKVGDFD